MSHLKLIALAICILSSFAWCDDLQDAKTILKSVSNQSGLCVDLGGTLAADLAANSGYLVHGIALDDASLARVRAAINAKGVAGQANVEKIAVVPLPYLRDLANIVVVEDMSALQKAGVKMEEIRAHHRAQWRHLHQAGRWLEEHDQASPGRDG